MINEWALGLEKAKFKIPNLEKNTVEFNKDNFPFHVDDSTITEEDNNSSLQQTPMFVIEITSSTIQTQALISLFPEKENKNKASAQLPKQKNQTDLQVGGEKYVM